MSRRITCAVAGLLAVAAIGCGGDDEPTSAAPVTDSGATATASGTETTSTTAPEGARRDRDEREQSAPDDAGAPQPGVGEETRNGGERVRTEVVLTARDGRIAPALVRVPADVPIAVELQGGDPADELRIDGRDLGPGAPPLTLDPLPRGSSYSGRTRSGGRVEVSATAEPGP